MATDNLRQQMERAMQKRVRAPVATVMKRLTLEAFTRVVQRTPVDSGRARGNWQVGVGVRPTTHSMEVADKATAGSPPSGDGMAMALEQVGKVTAETEATYVVNNLPYAEALENGHSKQAPNGMVAVTVAELREASREIIKQVVKS